MASSQLSVSYVLQFCKGQGYSEMLNSRFLISNPDSLVFVFPILSYHSYSSFFGQPIFCFSIFLSYGMHLSSSLFIGKLKKLQQTVCPLLNVFGALVSSLC